jgi:hypothetical protein
VTNHVERGDAIVWLGNPDADRAAFDGYLEALELVVIPACISPRSGVGRVDDCSAPDVTKYLKYVIYLRLYAFCKLRIILLARWTGAKALAGVAEGTCGDDDLADDADRLVGSTGTCR